MEWRAAERKISWRSARRVLLSSPASMRASLPPAVGPTSRPEGRPALSLVLPCFNEEANVEQAVREAAEAARGVAEVFEIVVVDDGSSDRTAARVRALQARMPEVVLVRHDRNQGYGAALRTGFRAARHPWVFYTDGDAQFDARQLVAVAPLLDTTLVVAGYRSPRNDGSAVRTLLGRGWTWVANRSLGLSVRDVNCAFKVFPKELLDDIPLRSQGAAIDAEILAEAKRRGLRIEEVPVAHRPRRAGQSTGARPRVALRALWELAWLSLRMRWDA